MMMGGVASDFAKGWMFLLKASSCNVASAKAGPLRQH